VRDAFVHGAHVTRFGRGAESLEALAREAAAPLLRHEPQALFVGNQGAEVFGDGASVAGRIADALGLTGAPAVRVETATSSGASAFAAAVDAVRAGRFATALVLGVERMTHVPTEEALAALAAMLAPDERAAGASPAALAGLVARRYTADFGLSREDLADVSVWAHEAAARNPDAQFHGKRVTREDVLASPELCDPLRTLDAAPLSDGAAALVVSSRRGPVRVAGIGHATDRVSFAARDDPDALVSFKASRQAGARAAMAAGWAPQEVDVLEVHDAFSVLAPIAVEDLGLARRGEGHAWLAANRARVNPGGGLKARGHPAGASGAAQLVEVFAHLTGAAGARQVPRARRGLAHSVGGFGTNAVVTLLEADR
jgi:acetyl-CoA C-acetyltransferase